MALDGNHGNKLNVDGFTLREIDPAEVPHPGRAGRYGKLVNRLRAIPPNIPIEIIPEHRGITLASFRSTLLSQACRMVPPVKLRTRFNRNKTGLVVWRAPEQPGSATGA